MFRLTLPTIAILALTSLPALAAHCPQDAAAIDAALAKVTLSDDVKAQVMTLRDEGMAAHEAGNHDESEEKLAEAMRLILTSI
jgi:hypothetical protein